MKSFLFCCITGMVVLAGCSTGSAPPPNDGPHIIDFQDNTTPVVELFTPVNNQSFTNGDTIKITGRITDNSLYQGFIRITDDANGATLKEQLYEIHGLQLYNFYLDYRPAVTASSNYTVTVQFQDHGFNVGSKIAKVKVDP